MISYLNPECLQSLETKIDEKAPDLFKAKPEKPQLKAIRLLKTKTEEGEEITRVTKYADVADFSRIKALENVRRPYVQFPLPASSVPSRYFPPLSKLSGDSKPEI